LYSIACVLFFSFFFLLLLSLQVPEHVKWFSNAKNFGCVEGVVSLSDLSIEAIALIHRYLVPCWWWWWWCLVVHFFVANVVVLVSFPRNVVQGLNFCQGLEGMAEDEKRWWKANESSIVKEEL
jgi:hypothetical protein